MSRQIDEYALVSGPQLSRDLHMEYDASKTSYYISWMSRGTILLECKSMVEKAITWSALFSRSSQAISFPGNPKQGLYCQLTEENTHKVFAFGHFGPDRGTQISFHVLPSPLQNPINSRCLHVALCFRIQSLALSRFLPSLTICLTSCR